MGRCIHERRSNRSDGSFTANLTGKWPAATRRTTKCDSVSRSSGCKLTPTRPFEEPDRGEWMQTKLLHLIGDFSQPAILQDMSGNSVKISKTYFQNCTASSNPGWSSTQSMTHETAIKQL